MIIIIKNKKERKKGTSVDVCFPAEFRTFKFKMRFIKIKRSFWFCNQTNIIK